eukprot:363692-Chlamydomonas_euryale.AAC.5
MQEREPARQGFGTSMTAGCYEAPHQDVPHSSRVLALTVYTPRTLLSTPATTSPPLVCTPGASSPPLVCTSWASLHTLVCMPKASMPLLSSTMPPLLILSGQAASDRLGNRQRQPMCPPPSLPGHAAVAGACGPPPGFAPALYRHRMRQSRDQPLDTCQRSNLGLASLRTWVCVVLQLWTAQPPLAE